MKIKLLALSAGLTLLLSACLPDLPDPVGQVEVLVTPAAAAQVSMDWTIEGASSFNPGVPELYEGTCVAGCAEFDQTVLMGEWEFRMSPPAFDASNPDFGWVGTGSVEEVSADYVEEFSLAQQATQQIEASFRPPDVLEWDVDAGNVAGVAAVSLTDVVSGTRDFTLAGLTVTCRAEVGDPLEFALPADTATSITDAPQTIGLEYAGAIPNPVFRGDVLCYGLYAWDSDNRPLADIRAGP